MFKKDARRDINEPLPTVESLDEFSLTMIKLSEYLLQVSSSSHLIAITMPIPKLNVDPQLYLKCLEICSMHLPPVMFIRGNQEDVITIES